MVRLYVSGSVQGTGRRVQIQFARWRNLIFFHISAPSPPMACCMSSLSFIEYKYAYRVYIYMYKKKKRGLEKGGVLQRDKGNPWVLHALPISDRIVNSLNAIRPLYCICICIWVLSVSVSLAVPISVSVPTRTGTVCNACVHMYLYLTACAKYFTAWHLLRFLVTLAASWRHS